MSKIDATTGPSGHALRVQLLGAFSVWVDGRRVPAAAWTRTSAANLVKLLALEPGRRLHREQVAERLWPDVEPDLLASRVDRAVYYARRVLQPGVGSTASRFIHREHALISLSTAPAVWVDVDAFRSAAAHARMTGEVEAFEAALGLYSGDLLPENPFDDWALSQREALHRERVALLTDLARACERRGDHAGTLAALRRIVDVEPTNEPAHVTLMRLYAIAGDRGAALRQYRLLDSALQRELDTTPNAASERLFWAIRDRKLEPTGAAHAAGKLSAQDSMSSPAVAPAGARSAAATPRHNLPFSRLPLIGREAELRDCIDRLRHPDVALVTLHGAGGVGKTRLARELGSMLLSDFPDGVWFVGLSSLSDHRLVLPAIGRSVGLRETATRTFAEELADHLGDRRALLILDNFEQVIDAAPDVAGLLERCPAIKVLVTSRVALRVSLERLVRVPPLPLADPASAPQDPTVRFASIATAPSTRLFVERARAVRAEFSLDTQTAEHVAAICERVDGLPLALELAAAWIRVLPAHRIPGRLTSPLDFLGDGPRDIPERHRSLRQTVAWSHGLLKPPERELFRRLAVFRGGWTLEAAERVCGGAFDPVTLGALIGLVDKSLVEWSDGADGEPRYSMLATIREFAVEQLVASGESDELSRRHAEYFLALADAAEPYVRSPLGARWLDQLEADHDNFRAALEWSQARSGDPELILRLPTALNPFWFARGYFSEGRRWMRTALDRTTDCPEGLRLHRAVALSRAAAILNRLGDYAESETRLREALAIGEAIGTLRVVTLALGHLAVLAGERGDHAQQRALLERSLGVAREAQDTWQVASCLTNLMLVAGRMSEFCRAGELYLQSLDAWRSIGEDWGVSVTQQGMGVAAVQRRDYEAARGFLREALEGSRQLGDTENTARCLIATAHLAAGLASEDSLGPEPWRLVARLAAAGASQLDQIGVRLFRHWRVEFEALVARIAGRLGPDEFSAEWSAGQSWSLDAASESAMVVCKGGITPNGRQFATTS